MNKIQKILQVHAYPTFGWVAVIGVLLLVLGILVGANVWLWSHVFGS